MSIDQLQAFKLIKLIYYTLRNIVFSIETCIIINFLFW